jgi:hypothetical protein
MNSPALERRRMEQPSPPKGRGRGCRPRVEGERAAVSTTGAIGRERPWRRLDIRINKHNLSYNSIITDRGQIARRPIPSRQMRRSFQLHPTPPAGCAAGAPPLRICAHVATCARRRQQWLAPGEEFRLSWRILWEAGGAASKVGLPRVAAVLQQFALGAGLQ